MAISELPIAAKIKDKHLANAVSQARLFWLAEWTQSRVIGLVNDIEDILNTGRSTFPAFAKYDPLRLTERLEGKGDRRLADLISKVGTGEFWSGLTLLAAAKGQRDIAIITAGKALAAGDAKAAEEHHKHIRRQRSNARAGGVKSHDKAAPRHKYIEEQILKLRNAGYPERSICSTLARKAGMPSEWTIRRVRAEMDDQ